jgi:mannose-6-phosphate isomerase-like protein (cupin superfamily)
MATAREKAAPSLSDSLDANLLTWESRQPSWQVFAFETQIDPRYARCQRRYLGASGSVSHDVVSSYNALPADCHTLSVMMMPAGNHQPFHHHDEAETFFVLEGSPTVMWQEGGEIVERKLGKWDAVYNPPGRIHALRNDGPDDCYFQVMLGSPRPQRPQYTDPDMARLQKSDDPDRK